MKNVEKIRRQFRKNGARIHIPVSSKISRDSPKVITITDRLYLDVCLYLFVSKMKKKPGEWHKNHAKSGRKSRRERARYILISSARRPSCRQRRASKNYWHKLSVVCPGLSTKRFFWRFSDLLALRPLWPALQDYVHLAIGSFWRPKREREEG